MGESADLPYENVDGLGAAVAHAAGVEVGQDLCPPGAQGPAEPCDFRDRTRRERSDDLLRQGTAGLGWLRAAVDLPELLVAGPPAGSGRPTAWWLRPSRAPGRCANRPRADARVR